MKKIIRLTESDLTKIVKRIIKENEFGSGSECEDLLEDMYDSFKHFMSHVQTSPETESPEDMYDDLQSELGGFLNMAEEMECEDIDDLYVMYNEFLQHFASVVGLEP